MKLSKCADAYNALLELEGRSFPYAFAHALVMLKEELLPHVLFYGGEELKLIEKYGLKGDDGQIISEGGKYRIEKERLNEYAAERKKLDEVEVELDRRRVGALPDRITPRQLAALRGLLDLPEEKSDEAPLS